MTRIKTSRAVQREYEAVKEALDSLQQKQARLQLLRQVQDKGVSRSHGTWFVVGNDDEANAARSK